MVEIRGETMSHIIIEGIEGRVGALEGDVSRLRTDVAVLGTTIHDVKTQNVTILTAIQSLEKRDLTRPAPTNWRTVAATTATLATLAIFGITGIWYSIQVSPSVIDLEKRLTKLDDPEVGKVTRLQDQLRWQPTIKK